MRKITTYCLLFFCTILSAQKNTKISTIDFVQILNNNKKEVVFYYENNWEILRKMAIKKNYIDSYQLLETSGTKNAPFSFMLITTYKDKKQFEKREKHFEELIKKKGKLRLLNEKKPNDFRKTIFGKDVYHKE
jgi:hypothetical protein